MSSFGSFHYRVHGRCTSKQLDAVPCIEKQRQNTRRSYSPPHPPLRSRPLNPVTVQAWRPDLASILGGPGRHFACAVLKYNTVYLTHFFQERVLLDIYALFPELRFDARSSHGGPRIAPAARGRAPARQPASHACGGGEIQQASSNELGQKERVGPSVSHVHRYMDTSVHHPSERNSGGRARARQNRKTSQQDGGGLAHTSCHATPCQPCHAIKFSKRPKTIRGKSNAWHLIHTLVL